MSSTRSESRFIESSRLPRQVFIQPAKGYRFTEFEMVFSDEYWYSMSQLGDASDDRVVKANVVEPDAAYYDEIGVASKAEISLHDSPAQYLRWVQDAPAGHIADALVHSARTLAFEPPSGAWAIWAQRDVEVAVLAIYTPALMTNSGPQPLAWYTASEALHHLIALTYRGGKVPTAFADELLKNYGSGESRVDGV